MKTKRQCSTLVARSVKRIRPANFSLPSAEFKNQRQSEVSRGFQQMSRSIINDKLTFVGLLIKEQKPCFVSSNHSA